MKKVAIFDFNRTLYDPERCRLAPHAHRVLGALVRRGYELYLVSTANPTRRQLIRELGLAPYFKRIFVARSKAAGFKTIARRRTLNRAESFVVGDRAWREIAHGNALGLRTVWLKAGKFAAELPRSKRGKPAYIIRSLREVLDIA